MSIPLRYKNHEKTVRKNQVWPIRYSVSPYGGTEVDTKSSAHALTAALTLISESGSVAEDPRTTFESKID